MENKFYFSITFIAIALCTSLKGEAAPLTPEQLNLPPEVIENSPVLQRWTKEIPNVLQEIHHDPSFKTRWRLGYAQFPSNHHEKGFTIGVEDLFLQSKTPLTFSADYQKSFEGDRQSFSVHSNYYLLPLGQRINLAPTLGYQIFNGEDYNISGVDLGAKLSLNLSRSGAANINLSQTFTNPTGNSEMGITTLSVGYAVSSQWRVSTDIQKHNSSEAKESRIGFLLEWMPK